MHKHDLTDSINEMLHMQSQLNVATNGENWRSGMTGLGKTIDWRRCIYMETAELIDSYPWKHWKSVEAPIDEENVRIELVDIWHFILSLLLEKMAVEQASDLLLSVQNVSVEQIVDARDGLSVMDKVAVHEALMACALQKGDVSEVYLRQLLESFLSSCKVAGLDFQQLYRLYMAKNVLNRFRQDHGYKEGTYTKLWNGREDNVVMFEIIREMTVFSGEELYRNLKLSYAEID
ncbi:dUTP diphosphatase [Thiomicrorhabdus sp.]|uniref:dUTP diphosphatase n=1 Tax=Thiomicrorhabdus sp. TaxID=2039724 RepID=UPI0029C6893E|nr:dUTP diphosphatase [Thiomicrorhabdus sp.]